MDTFIPTFDAAAIGVTLFTFTVYLICYESRVHDAQTSMNTQTGRNFENMSLWVIKHNANPDAASVTLAVQTLRNTILVGVFVGGSSLTYAVGACDILTRQEVPPQLVCRQLIIGALLFISFLNWTQVIRFANHIGFYVGTLQSHIVRSIEERKSRTAAPAQSALNPNASSSGISIECHESSPAGGYGEVSSSTVLDDDYDTGAKAELKLMAHKLAAHFSWGFRFMYFTIPFWMYSGGPVALVVTAAFSIVFLALFDFPRSGANGNTQKQD